MAFLLSPQLGAPAAQVPPQDALKRPFEPVAVYDLLLLDHSIPSRPVHPLLHPNNKIAIVTAKPRYDSRFMSSLPLLHPASVHVALASLRFASLLFETDNLSLPRCRITHAKQVSRSRVSVSI